MTDPRVPLLLNERIETVMALSRLMAEELRLLQLAGGAEVERLGGLEASAGAEAEAELSRCRDRIAHLNAALERIDIALAAPDLD